MEKIVYLVSFLLAGTNYVVNFSIPLYLISKFSATPFILGIVGFFGNFAYTAFTYIFYKIKWKIHYPWFIISSLLISFAYFALPFLNSYSLIFIFLFFNGIFYSRFWPSLQYFFSSESQKIDRYNLAWSSGVIFGVFVSGYLFKIKNTLPFFIGSFSAFLGFTLSFINFEKFNQIYKNLPEKFTNKKTLNKEIKKVFFLNFVNFFAIGGILYLFPKLALTIGYTPPLISNIVTSLFIVRFFMFYIFSKIKIKLDEKTLFFSYFSIFISLIFTGISKTPIFHTFCLYILGTSSAFSFRMGILNVIEKGFSTELNESIIGIGLFVGPLILGSLSQIFGIYNGFIFSGVIILMFFILQKYLIK
ncbi:MAG: MFS transporter [Candidatus Omnitrophica bacterium]|nr:MFS transporter [Candidatus Omnitrophota bacterium]